MSWTFETVVPATGKPVGGVTWDGRRVLLSRPDEELIVAVDPSSGDVTPLRRHTGGIRGLGVGPGGELYGAQTPSRRVVQLCDDGSTVVLPYRLGGRIHNLPTDLDVDSSGSIWFCDAKPGLRTPGPQVYPLLDHASVLQLQRGQRGEWRLRRRTWSTTAPRALALSVDERTLFVSEHNADPHAPRELRRYGIHDDQPDDVVVLETFGHDRNGPHPGVAAMSITADGDIVACAGGADAGPGAVLQQITAQGRIVRSEAAPATLVASTFAEADLSALYVGTDDGALLRVADTGLRGHRRHG